MAAYTDITPIIAIPPEKPEFHWDWVHTIREELRGLPGNCAPLWIHPASPNLAIDPERLPEAAYRSWRATSIGERFALTGYVGAPRAALTADELKRELEWAKKNPWEPAATLYGLDEPKPIRTAVIADPTRDLGPGPGRANPTTEADDLGEGPTSHVRSKRARQKKSTTLIAVVREERQERLLYRHNDDYFTMPLFRLRRELLDQELYEKELGRFLRNCRRSEERGVLLLASDEMEPALPLLRESLRRLRESRALSKRLEIVAFQPESGRREEAEPAGANAQGFPVVGSPFSISLHRGLRQASAERSLPGVNRERQRQVLRAFQERRPQEKRNRGYGDRRVYTAAMHGSAEIIGDSFSVRTEAGRPAALRSPKGEIGLGVGGATTLRYTSNLNLLPPDLCAVESVTAFSFDGPLSRGIREESRISGSLTGKARLDSFFLTDFEELFLALELSLAGSLPDTALLSPVEFLLARGEPGKAFPISVTRTLHNEELSSEEYLPSSGSALPIFATELSLDGGAAGFKLHCGCADFWKATIAQMALLGVPSKPGDASRKRRRPKGGWVAFAPFGLLQIEGGRDTAITLRRTVRMKPGGATPPFGRLSRDLSQEILLWEGDD